MYSPVMQEPRHRHHVLPRTLREKTNQTAVSESMNYPEPVLQMSEKSNGRFGVKTSPLIFDPSLSRQMLIALVPETDVYTQQRNEFFFLTSSASRPLLASSNSSRDS